MTTNGGPGRDVLYRTEAVERAERVHDVSYELSFELAEGRETYTGRAVIEFRLTGADTPLFLDFTGEPRMMTVNGSVLEPDQRGQRLWLPASHLVTHNRVVLEFENAFDGTGDGFHRFVDPEDRQTYLYSNLEPFSAHRLFPCFDQPDIKATYRLLVTAPAGWRVISAVAPAEVSDLPDRRELHDFMSTPRFSTYLFSLIAGPYERIGGDHDGIPLGLFGRASMRRELERSADELFEVTGQGMDYFAKLFGRRYPFSKYDQLFVPEFNAGAMENVGAVTFHDSFIFRDPPTYSQRLVRGEVILHELAHMWFGDLVTMRWWDDLWLNETFATYLSYRSLADATRFGDAWQVFNGQMRPAAYRQDQLVTTHPIATPVEHTDQAIGNFDAITYEKGAAVIKQLVAALGDEAFRTGLHTYFDRHAWGNATLADFLGALGDAAGHSLDEWARLWLQTPSLNTIGAHWTESEGRIAVMELRQDASDPRATLRPHSTSIGLVSRPAEGGELTVDAIPVDIDAERQAVPAAVGRPTPLFVYPNHGDHDYALAELDPVSLEFALERLPDVPHALLRQQVWSTLWEMVRGANLRSTEYLEAVRQFAPRETDRALVQSIVDRASVVQRRYVPDDEREATASSLTASAIAALRSAEDQDLRLIWARAAVALAARADDVSDLLDLVDGRWSVAGFEPDQQSRWTLATKAVAFGLDGAAERLDIERLRDPSDRGQRAVIRAEVGRPDSDSKQVAWDRIHGEGYGSDYLTRAAIMGFQWVHQRDLLVSFREPFYEHITDVYANRDHAYAESYLRWLVPDRWAEPAELERIRVFADGLGEQQGLLRRHLVEIADDVARDIRVREFSAAVS
jgi:aminopeptidase N